MPTTYDDEFYRDILEGLSIYTDSALQRDVLHALSTWQARSIGEALNKNQIASKMWLAQALFDSVGGQLGQVLILGGWVGVLSALLLHDRRFLIDRVVSIDIDPSCAPVAQALNATHAKAGRFVATTRDMLAIDYAREFPASPGDTKDVIVNTSCEHLADFDDWFARLPAGRLLVLQSNDYFQCHEHIACVPDLATFRSQAPLASLLFAGERKLRRYTRFMLIGTK